MSRLPPKQIQNIFSDIFSDILECDRICAYTKDSQGNLLGRLRSGNELLEFAIAPNNLLYLVASPVRNDAYLEGYYLKDCQPILGQNSTEYERGLLESAWRKDARNKQCKTGKRCGETCIAKDLECKGTPLSGNSAQLAQKLRLAIPIKSNATNAALIAAAGIAVGAGGLAAAQKIKPQDFPSFKPASPLTKEATPPLPKSKKELAREFVGRHKVAIASLGATTTAIGAAIAVERQQEKEFQKYVERNAPAIEQIQEESKRREREGINAAISKRIQDEIEQEKAAGTYKPLRSNESSPPKEYYPENESDEEFIARTVGMLQGLVEEAERNKKVAAEAVNATDPYMAGLAEKTVDKKSLQGFEEYAQALEKVQDYAKDSDALLKAAQQDVQKQIKAEAKKENSTLVDAYKERLQAIQSTFTENKRLQDTTEKLVRETKSLVNATRSFIRQEEENRRKQRAEMVQYESAIASGKSTLEGADDFDKRLVTRPRVLTDDKGQIDLEKTAIELYDSFQSGTENEGQFNQQWDNEVSRQLDKVDTVARDKFTQDYEKAIARPQKEVASLENRLKNEPDILGLGDRKREAIRRYQTQLEELKAAHEERLKAYDEMKSELGNDYKAKHQGVRDRVYQLTLDRIEAVTNSLNSPKLNDLRSQVEIIRSNPKLTKVQIQESTQKLNAQIKKLEQEAIKKATRSSEMTYKRGVKDLYKDLRYKSGDRTSTFEAEYNRRVERLRSEKPLRPARKDSAKPTRSGYHWVEDKRAKKGGYWRKNPKGAATAVAGGVAASALLLGAGIAISRSKEAPKPATLLGRIEELKRSPRMQITPKTVGGAAVIAGGGAIAGKIGQFAVTANAKIPSSAFDRKPVSFNGQQADGTPMNEQAAQATNAAIQELYNGQIDRGSLVGIEHRDTWQEYMINIDAKTGKATQPKGGGQINVEISDTDFHPGQNILVHNHPNATSLSPMDIGTAIDHKDRVDSVIAVDRAGNTYHAKLKPDAMFGTNSMAMQMGLHEMTQKFSANMAQNPKFIAQYARLSKDSAAGDFIATHVTMLMAKERGMIDYNYQLTPEFAKLERQYQGFVDIALDIARELKKQDDEWRASQRR